MSIAIKANSLPQRYIHKYIFIYIYMYIYVYVGTHICMYVCMHACMHVFMCVCVYVCMCICMCVCMLYSYTSSLYAYKLNMWQQAGSRPSVKSVAGASGTGDHRTGLLVLVVVEACLCHIPTTGVVYSRRDP